MLIVGVRCGRAPTSTMRMSLHLAGLAALAAALLLGPVPVLHCQTVAACPMLEALAPPCTEGHCDPVPRIDCCVDHPTPPAQASGSTGLGQLASVAVAPAAASGATVTLPPRPRTTLGPARGDDPVPLYTLHATLLI